MRPNVRISHLASCYCTFYCFSSKCN